MWELRASLAMGVLLVPPSIVGAFLAPAAFNSCGRGFERASDQRKRRGARPSTPPTYGKRQRMSADIATDYEVTVGENGVSSLVVRLPSSEVKFETGRIGRQAHGSVVATDGETVLFSTACAALEGGALDFVPLKVDYMERFSAAGMTSGGYNKREGRASDKEVLVSRLMDRPLRPMIAEGWTHETQLLTWVLSYDGVRPTEPLAITSAAAALSLSHIPLARPVAGVTVGMNEEGGFVANPSREMLDTGRLALTLAGTIDGVLMIEGFCSFLSEAQMMEAVEVGHAAVRALCRGMQAWTDAVGKPKKLDTLRKIPPGLKEALAAAFTPQMDLALQIHNKAKRGAAAGAIDDAAVARFTAGEGLLLPYGGQFEEIDVKVCLKKLWASRLRTMVREKGIRPDGRTTTEVRPIDVALSVLPRTHGSALFTRGETQALATVTLGGGNMQQKTESIAGTEVKRFYLQYAFPPCSVGEVGRVGAPGRREVGHGSLAERALAPVLPAAEIFPYSARVESLITESCGSSSMASVCGGSLALMDAGVPLTCPVAGVAMGLLLDEEAVGAAGAAATDVDSGAVILTDILGLEDALGTMDFKVAGTADAITSFQLDIKCEGLTLDLMRRALAQAREGRLHILGEMAKALPESRGAMSRHVPVATVLKVLPDQIGRVIGPGGKQIRQIIADFNLTNMELEDNGTCLITSDDPEKNEKAKKFIEVLLAEEPRGRGGRRERPGVSGTNGTMPELDADGEPIEKMVPVVGSVYRGCEVRGVHSYGAFVQLGPGVDGLVHISELDSQRVRSVEAFLKIGDKVDVKLLAVNERGQLRLSRKAVLEEDKAAIDAAWAASQADGSGAAATPVATTAVNGAGDVTTIDAAAVVAVVGEGSPSGKDAAAAAAVAAVVAALPHNAVAAEAPTP